MAKDVLHAIATKPPGSRGRKKETLAWYLNAKLMIELGFGILISCSLGLFALLQFVSRHNTQPPKMNPKRPPAVTSEPDAPLTSTPTVIDGHDAVLDAVE